VTAAKKKGLPKRTKEHLEEDIVELSSKAMEEKDKKKDTKTKDSHKSSASKKELIKKLEKLELEKNEVSDRLLRTMAEFDNYKKRMMREKSAALKYAGEPIFKRGSGHR